MTSYLHLSYEVIGGNGIVQGLWHVRIELHALHSDFVWAVGDFIATSLPLARRRSSCWLFSKDASIFHAHVSVCLFFKMEDPYE